MADAASTVSLPELIELLWVPVRTRPSDPSCDHVTPVKVRVVAVPVVVDLVTACADPKAAPDAVSCAVRPDT